MSTLNDFLGDDAGPDESAPAPAAETPAAASPAAETPELKPEAAEEPEHVVPDDVRGLRDAVVATRKERNDHKGRADRLEGEMAAVKAELEAARKAAAAPPPAEREGAREPVTIPSPLEDPQGYHQYQERLRWNDRLNTSEMMLRAQHDAADVDARIAVFKKAADANPALQVELTRQAHPYLWAYQQAQRIQAMEEIGTDPAAFRAKIEAEARAKFEAEYATGEAGGGVARVRLPQSLGTARNVGARLAAVQEAPEFEDIFAKKKRA